MEDIHRISLTFKSGKASKRFASQSTNATKAPTSLSASCAHQQLYRKPENWLCVLGVVDDDNGKEGVVVIGLSPLLLLSPGRVTKDSN